MAAPRAPLDLACEGEPYAFAKMFVAQFNQRAITVHERVGFRAVGTSARQTPQGSLNFVAMELTVSPDREF